METTKSFETWRPLETWSFCVTGKLEHFTRKEIKEFIEKFGGTFHNTLTLDTYYLVANDQSKMTTKLYNAKRYGTPIITEKELMEMVWGVKG